MTAKIDLENRYKIIETKQGPMISESRMTVYDVLEEMNYGKGVYQISEERNLTPLQVQTAFNYIEKHHDRLQTELTAIIEKAQERRKYYDALADEIRKKIAMKPMTPERARLRELITRNRAKREAHANGSK